MNFFGSQILAKSDFWGVYERCWDFFGSRKNTEGFFGVVKSPDYGIFLGMLKK